MSKTITGEHEKFIPIPWKPVLCANCKTPLGRKGHQPAVSLHDNRSLVHLVCPKELR